MASGTARVFLNPTTPQRFDDTAVFVSGEVFGTGVSIWYQPALTAPASLFNGKAFDHRENFSFTMGAGESLWAAGPEGSYLEITRRQA